jgi:hypothetical protein
MIALLLVLAACNGSSAATSTPPPDPLALIQQAARIRQASTFRIDVSYAGPDYNILTDFGPVLFRRAAAQYVSPNVMQAEVRVLAGSLPVDVDVFSRGADQWFRAIWTANLWLNTPFAPGFNPETLIAEETGFQIALDAIREMAYAGTTTLQTGAAVYHITGRADGMAMNALLVGLLEMQGEVSVDVYIDIESGHFARFVARETVPDAEALREWTINILDIDGPPTVDDPALSAEATAQATAAEAATSAAGDALNGSLFAPGAANAASTPEATAAP